MLTEKRTKNDEMDYSHSRLEFDHNSSSLPDSIPSTFWEQISKCRWGQYISEIERRAILMAHSILGKPTHALEVGCEGGRWSLMLSKLGWQMTCTDVNSVALQICKQRIPTATCVLVKNTSETLPCETNTVDLLLCIEVTRVAETDWFLNEAARVLRPNGLLVSVVTNSRSARGFAYRTMAAFSSRRKTFREESGIYSGSYRSMKKRLNDVGFEIVYDEGMCWLPFSRKSNSPLIPPLTSMEQIFGLRKLRSLSPWVVCIARLKANLS